MLGATCRVRAEEIAIAQQSPKKLVRLRGKTCAPSLCMLMRILRPPQVLRLRLVRELATDCGAEPIAPATVGAVGGAGEAPRHLQRAEPLRALRQAKGAIADLARRVLVRQSCGGRWSGSEAGRQRHESKSGVASAYRQGHRSEGQGTAVRIPVRS